jgi:protein-serine/threonine kinase
MQETRYQSDEPSSSPARQRHTSVQYEKPRPNAIPPYLQREAVLNTESDSSVENLHKRHPSGAPYQGGVFSHSEGYDGRRIGSGRTGRGVLQKNKRFTDAYDEENRGHEGSSGAARRVMDFFRRRGKARGGEER